MHKHTVCLVATVASTFSILIFTFVFLHSSVFVFLFMLSLLSLSALPFLDFYASAPTMAGGIMFLGHLYVRPIRWNVISQ